MSSFRGLKIGDQVRLTGSDWPAQFIGTLVTVDQMRGLRGLQAWSSIKEIGSLTAVDGYSYGGGYAIARPEETHPSDGQIGPLTAFAVELARLSDTEVRNLARQQFEELRELRAWKAARA